MASHKKRPLYDPKSTKSLIVGFISLVCVGVLSYSIGATQGFGKQEEKKVTSSRTKTILASGDCTDQKLIDNAKMSVVRVIGDRSEGTGFIIKPNGYIVTNYHLIKSTGFPRIVTADNTSVVGRVFSWDEQSDVAIIKIHKENLTPLQFGDSTVLEPGQALFGLGFPLGQSRLGEATVTNAIFSTQRSSSNPSIEYIQLETTLNEGQSGSPIINTCGKVMGVLLLGTKGTEGLKFAITSKTLQTLSKLLITNGQRDTSVLIGVPLDDQTFLGTVTQFYDNILSKRLDLAYGLLSNKFKQSTGDFSNFANGYNSTINVYAQEIRPDYFAPNSVYVRIGAVDLVGESIQSRIFAGTWNLVYEDGMWKMDQASIQQINQ